MFGMSHKEEIHCSSVLGMPMIEKVEMRLERWQARLLSKRGGGVCLVLFWTVSYVIPLVGLNRRFMRLGSRSGKAG